MGNSSSSSAQDSGPRQPQTILPPTFQQYPPTTIYLPGGQQGPVPHSMQQQQPGYNGGQYYNTPYAQQAQQRPPQPTIPQPHYPSPPAGQGQYGAGPRPVVQTQEYQTTATIRNQVNLKKHTLKLVPTSTPGVLAITFQFDASAPCRATTFVLGTEDSKRACRITSTVAPIPAGISYEKGLELQFPPTNGPITSHVINLSSLPAADLMAPSGDTFPLIIRLEALTDEGRAEGQSLERLEPGAELPRWVQSQSTYARLTHEEDGSWGVRVVKQKIWVKGSSYELQEIYGMEQNRAGPNANVVDGFEDVDGNECVICMSARRDTTALPCRHMCMCHSCAGALKNQSNKCPVCRQEIESLLHIQIQKTEGTGPNGRGEEHVTGQTQRQ